MVPVMGTSNPGIEIAILETLRTVHRTSELSIIHCAWWNQDGILLFSNSGRLAAPGADKLHIIEGMPTNTRECQNFEDI